MEMMKTCFKCGVEKPSTDFYRHPRMKDGRLGKCKTCTMRDVRENYRSRRAQYSEYYRRREQTPERKAWQAESQRRRRAMHPERNKARQRVQYAVRTGKIKKQPCEVCGAKKATAHHDDYSKPLQVRWLCWEHHMRAHGKCAVKKNKRLC